MSKAQNFTYETRLNVLYEPLQVIDEKVLADACAYKWYNQTLVSASIGQDCLTESRSSAGTVRVSRAPSGRSSCRRMRGRFADLLWRAKLFFSHCSKFIAHLHENGRKPCCLAMVLENGLGE